MFKAIISLLKMPVQIAWQGPTWPQGCQLNSPGLAEDQQGECAIIYSRLTNHSNFCVPACYQKGEVCFAPSSDFTGVKTAEGFDCYTAWIRFVCAQSPHKHKRRWSCFMSSPSERHPLSLCEADSKWPPSALKLIIIVFPNSCSAGHYILCYWL